MSLWGWGLCVGGRWYFSWNLAGGLRISLGRSFGLFFLGGCSWRRGFLHSTRNTISRSFGVSCCYFISISYSFFRSGSSFSILSRRVIFGLTIDLFRCFGLCLSGVRGRRLAVGGGSGESKLSLIVG